MIRILYAVEADLSAKSGDSMSAICGIIHFDGRPVEQSDLEIMVESSSNRGPDGTGYWLQGNAGFAHLAFHVTPESVGERQPLESADGRLVLVADVRLDNRDELASALGIKKNELTELSDPDLLLRAYQKWEKHCTKRLLGDFVFALWDAEAHEVFLARDQLGGYGLSYHWMGRTLVFASETAAILDLPAVQPEINQDAVLKTLAAMGLNEDETFFKSIHYLPPGHCMHASDLERRKWRYWDIDPGFRISYRNEDEYTDHFLELMGHAVACRLRSIHPVGISLSGGHDSTLLAAIAARQLRGSNQVLQSFSNVFDRFTECDERRWIQPVVDRYGINAHFISSDEMWAFSDWEIRKVPKDFFWTNCYAQLPEAIAKTARQAGCHLLIDGMFGDALFCNPGLFAADLLRSGRFSTLFMLLYRYRDSMSWRKELGRHGIRQLLPHQLRRIYRRLRPTRKNDMLPGLTKRCAERLAELRQKDKQSTEISGFSPGLRTRYHHIFQTAWAQGFAATRNVPYNRSGIERVSPYFDRRLVEFVMAIPAEQLSHPGRPRNLQNNAMRRLLPEEVWAREEKTQFSALLLEGLSRKGRDLLHEPVDVPRVLLPECVRREWLLTQLGQDDSLEAHAYIISNCLHLEQWRRSIQASLSGKQGWSEPAGPLT